MSIHTLIILAFLFSIAFFIIFLIALRIYIKSSSDKTIKSKSRASKDQNTNFSKIDTEDTLNLKKRLETIRQSEELIQGHLKEIEIEKKSISQEKKRINLERTQIDEYVKRLEDEKLELATLRKELEKMNQHKTEFLTNMSHELKTPLNSILTLTQVLLRNKENNLQDKQIKYLKTVNASGKTLLALINDVLDIAKIESGKTETFIEPITIQSIKEEIHETFFINREKTGVAFSIEVDDAVPDTIYSDKKRLLQILRNILSNAFKFTERGYIKFKILDQNSDDETRASMLSPENYIVFSVEDTGRGIEKDKQEMIFEEFVQADGSTTRQYGGTGLGLAISQKLTTLLGGEIQLKSEFGKGSTFNVFLPVSRKKTVEKQAVRKSHESLSNNNEVELGNEDLFKQVLKARKIVMITTDMKYLFLFTNLVESYQGSVIGANNVDEGIKRIGDNFDASLVVIDEYIFRENEKILLSEIKRGFGNKMNIVLKPEKEGNPEKLLKEFYEPEIRGCLPSNFEKTALLNQLLSLINQI